jgi:hypothetical protein
MKKLCVTLLFLAIGLQSLVAQDNSFKVLVNKGKNEVKTGGSWQAIKTGSTLKQGDEVKVSDNAYLGLIHVTGKPLEVKQAGSYKVDDLAAKLGGGTSVLNKYTDFILSSNAEKKNRLSATGAVHRGANTVKIYLPKSEAAILYGNNIVLDWEKQEGVDTYIVNMKSMFGDDLLSIETKEQVVTVNLDDPKFKDEDNIIIEIFPKGQPNKKPDPPYMLKKLSSADKDRINVMRGEISSATSDNTALSQLIMAGFYEQNKLLIDAITAYQEAMKLAPDVSEYREDYNNFLVRNGIKPEKKEK